MIERTKSVNREMTKKGISAVQLQVLAAFCRVTRHARGPNSKSVRTDHKEPSHILMDAHGRDARDTRSPQVPRVATSEKCEFANSVYVDIIDTYAATTWTSQVSTYRSFRLLSGDLPAFRQFGGQFRRSRDGYGTARKPGYSAHDLSKVMT